MMRAAAMSEVNAKMAVIIRDIVPDFCGDDD